MDYAQWRTIIYRAVRAGISSGMVAAWATQPDWTRPEDALRVVGIAFGTAFLVGIGKFLRDILDEHFGFDEKSVVAKVMPF